MIDTGRSLKIKKCRKLLKSIRPLTSQAQKPFVNRLERHLLCLSSKRFTTFNWLEYSLNVASSKRVSAKFEINFLFKLWSRMGVKRRHARFEHDFCLANAKKACKFKKNVQKLATPKRFLNVITRALNKKELHLILMLYVCLLTGRRGKLISKIKKKDVIQLTDSSYSVCSGFDKTGFGRSFAVNFDLLDDRWISPQLTRTGIVQIWQDSLNKSLPRDKLINVKLANLSRKVKSFHVHSLRRVRTIELIYSGFEQREIMSKLAWTCTDSYNRYKVLDADAIREFDRLEDVLNKIIDMGICC